MSGPGIAPFDALYRASPDPWSTANRWYEARKRSLLMAALPQRRYATAYEAGCGNGNLTRELLTRCDAIDASDGSDEALRTAREQLGDQQRVRFLHHVLPDQWPTIPYELIVLSEVLYFLRSDGIDRVAARIGEQARRGDTIVACDWRAPIEGFDHTGEEAHRRFETGLGMSRLLEYLDDDFVLTAWSRDRTSVAEREGVR